MSESNISWSEQCLVSHPPLHLDHLELEIISRVYLEEGKVVVSVRAISHGVYLEPPRFGSSE